MENATTANNAVNKSIFSSTANTGKAKASADNLDKDAFLKLLVTELRHQDPTQPMENKEFISQMATFSSLEQMTNMNKSIQALTKTNRSGEAYSLLGKNVKAFDPVTGVKVDGMVTSVFHKDDDIRLVVNGREVGINDVHSVYTNEPVNKADKPAESGINNSKDIKINNDTIKVKN